MGFLAYYLARKSWVSRMLKLRSINFKDVITDVNDQRKTPLRSGNDPARRSQEIEYHNHAIYRDFEFFYKVTLGLVGGIAYALIQSPSFTSYPVVLLVFLAGLLQVISGMLFSGFVVAHQKSKIERWENKYADEQIVSWQECRMVAGMVGISFLICTACFCIPVLNIVLQN